MPQRNWSEVHYYKSRVDYTHYLLSLFDRAEEGCGRRQRRWVSTVKSGLMVAFHGRKMIQRSSSEQANGKEGF